MKRPGEAIKYWKKINSLQAIAYIRGALCHGSPFSWRLLIIEIRDRFKVKTFILEVTMFLRQKIYKTETNSK